MSPSSSLLIHINDQPFRVEKGIMILQAARQNGIDIPTLCDFPGLPSHGSCRMCIVEIQGRPNTPTACTTPVEEGMLVYTHSPKVQFLRTEIIQMLLAEHPSGCVFCPEKDHCDECMLTLRKAGVTTGCGSCPKDQQCELQSLAEEYGVTKPTYPIHYRMLPLKKHDPFFDRDDNLCILCGRCIRVCENLHFANTLAYTQRGMHTLVGTAFQRTHLESSCTFCGTCVEVCPTGALSEKTRKWEGKPERETATTCPLCSIGCQIKLLVKQDRVLGSLPNRQAGTDVLCVKGRFAITELVNHPSRLKQPQKSAGNTRQMIGWDEAIHTAANKLAACPPEQFEMVISASCTNEDLFVARQFARQVMHSSNIRTTAQGNCASAARLLQDSCSLDSIAQSSAAESSATDDSAILCLGLEDPYAQSVVEVHLYRAKKQGAKIIQLSPRKHTGSSCADEWLEAAAGQETGALEELIQLTSPERGTDPDACLAETAALARAAVLLTQAPSPLIIIGPAFLAHPDQQNLLQSVERLVDQLGARVITLPDPGNLAGALRLGLGSAAPAPEGQDIQVRYLIGAAIPPVQTGDPYLIYQNLYPPAGGARADLLLPTTAFTEETGTYIDYAGREQAIHPAVPAYAEALPTWLILSRIARQMGAQGFEYACVEDVWNAISIFGVQASQTSSGLLEHQYTCTHSYMGFALEQSVEGLRSLYPAGSNGSVHEPNS